MGKYTYEDLKIMRSWPLQKKIQVSQTRIIEWLQHYNDKVYISFSGGKDSTVLIDLVRRINPDITAVFVDTGLEYPEIKDFVRCFENVQWLRPQKYDNKTKKHTNFPFSEVILEYGYPILSKEVASSIESYRSAKTEKQKDRYMNGDKYKHYKIPLKWRYLIDEDIKISARCCDVMKKQPIHRFTEQTGLVGIVGMLAEESRLRESHWLQYGCNTFDKSYPTSNPLSFWTNQDILQYLALFEDSIMQRIKSQRFLTEENQQYIDKLIHPWASVYGDIIEQDGEYVTTGLSRSGCMFCLFGIHLEDEPNRIQKMKLSHPKQYEFCINETRAWDLDTGEEWEFIDDDGKEMSHAEIEDICKAYKNDLKIKHGLGLGKVLDLIHVNYK